jgi:hypothetical protein
MHDLTTPMRGRVRVKGDRLTLRQLGMSLCEVRVCRGCFHRLMGATNERDTLLKIAELFSYVVVSTRS